ncbi:MAG: undecaprenyl-diphosphate phosphatase [Gammaproteobacteria bacterium]|nr:undecaprenyl-diphosphate phosphatase [Gammaproteobacteria bacterium]|tara:strand:+ start:4435 stop:5226 length:792 start_codon:yes stop_codon:yes gene_type:complete
MTVDYAIFLALIQGLTEFLPISSSAHLILPSVIFGWPDQGLAFDVAVHFGSLGAVILSLRVEIQRIVTGMVVKFGRRYPRHARLGWLIGLATFPAALSGLLAKDFIETSLRNEFVIALATVGFGFLLWWSHYQRGRSGFGGIGLRQAILIGCSQTLALIPGASRSGITLTAALWLGLSRRVAAKFSFLLSVPIILGATILKMNDLIESPDPLPWDTIAVGVIVSFLSAYLCIRLFLAWIQRVGLLPFVAYRLVLGVVLLIVII